jgi:hypothetical protein
MLNAEKYRRSLEMCCPACGGKQFEFDLENLEDSSAIKCNSCQTTFTKAALIKANNQSISEQIENMKAEVVADVGREMKSAFEKAFSGNKFIKTR